MASLDYSQPVNQVRLLIPDIIKLEDPKDLRKPPSYLFSDMELFGYLAIEGGNVKRAASRALMAIATSETLILKVISTDNKSTNGATLGAELRAQAKRLWDEAKEAETSDLGFDFLPGVVPPGEDWAWH